MRQLGFDLSHERYCIFGITRWGMILAYDLLGNGKSIVFSDNDKKKQGKIVIGNCLCIAPSDISNDTVCIISVREECNRESIYKQLKGLNVNSILFLDEKKMEEYEKRVEDEIYLKAIWYIRMGYELDLEHPATFNEKLQWLKLHDRDPKYTKMVDKYEVKKYVSGIIGEEHIIPTYGVWSSFGEIDFDKLPEKFILKCTHDSGSTFICTNKDCFDFEKAKNTISNALEKNYFYLFREWPYKSVKPRVIAEMYLEDETNSLGLNEKVYPNDYKVLCFNGKAKLIELIRGRGGVNMTQDFYDRNWNKLNIVLDHPNSEYTQKEPVNFEQMMLLSETLTRNMYHCRVDWYEVNHKLYFGEMTFYDNAGQGHFKKREHDLYIGKMLELG